MTILGKSTNYFYPYNTIVSYMRDRYQNGLVFSPHKENYVYDYAKADQILDYEKCYMVAPSFFNPLKAPLIDDDGFYISARNIVFVRSTLPPQHVVEEIVDAYGPDIDIYPVSIGNVDDLMDESYFREDENSKFISSAGYLCRSKFRLEPSDTSVEARYLEEYYGNDKNQQDFNQKNVYIYRHYNDNESMSYRSTICVGERFETSLSNAVLPSQTVSNYLKESDLDNIIITIEDEEEPHPFLDGDTVLNSAGVNILENTNSFDSFRENRKNIELAVDNNTDSGNITPNKTKQTQEKHSMSNVIETIGAAIKEANVEGAKQGAKIKVAEDANAVLMKLVKPQLPMMVRGYADTPLGKVVLANLVVMAVSQFASNNKKAEVISQAMIDVAYADLFRGIDIQGMIEEIVGQFKGDNIKALMKEAGVEDVDGEQKVLG
ncbi:hypothetical protein [Pseudoalteromonas phage J2-1_QLiu-2017]|nr:hypothetical protein [Pseudoalteromonas phage J2-1_QLiu-2017]